MAAGEAFGPIKVTGTFWTGSRLYGQTRLWDKATHDSSLITILSSMDLARRAGRPLRFALPDDAPPIQIDYLMIDQVLTNLLENAAKHTPPGMPIEVGVGS